MAARNTLHTAEAHFRAVLLPHRALGRKGFVVLMAFVGALSFLSGQRHRMQRYRKQRTRFIPGGSDESPVSSYQLFDHSKKSATSYIAFIVSPV